MDTTLRMNRLQAQSSVARRSLAWCAAMMITYCMVAGITHMASEEFDAAIAAAHTANTQLAAQTAGQAV